MLVFGENPAWRGRRILLMKKKRFSVEQIVGVLKQAQVGVPVVELIRKAGISEQTPLEYVTEWRMQKAVQLLEQRDKKLIDVARSLGYESDAAFSKAIKRVAGHSRILL
jgi:methylphosphotriester-DNA--protein-cysteine methyltransferase